MGLTVVTGGSRGLGREVARALSASGEHVISVSKDPERAAATASEIGADYETVDFGDIAATRAMTNHLLASYGTPQTLVLAHGVMCDRTAKTQIGRAHV